MVIAPEVLETNEAVAHEARTGLTAAPKTLSPWLFYDEAGSRLFEQITTLPEYYLTRTERSILAAHADEIVKEAAAGNNTQTDPKPLTLIELGAGTATKTGLLLQAAVRHQGSIVYQPVDVSPTALEEAGRNIKANIPGVSVRAQIADYTREGLPLNRLPNTRTLALYIGSSIGNFTPEDARDVLRNLRAQLLPGDTLLLGTDLRPNPNPDHPADCCHNPGNSSQNFSDSSHNPDAIHRNGNGFTERKDIATLLAAYNDAQGITAAFNRNVLTRLNRDLGANFHPSAFAHKAIWNPAESRIEMHLESLNAQRVRIPENSAGPALTLDFAPGETIHTENSYKFTPASVGALLNSAAFRPTQAWQDPHHYFAVTLATAI